MSCISFALVLVASWAIEDTLKVRNVLGAPCGQFGQGRYPEIKAQTRQQCYYQQFQDPDEVRWFGALESLGPPMTALGALP